jgi:hypothetical protein
MFSAGRDGAGLPTPVEAVPPAQMAAVPAQGLHRLVPSPSALARSGAEDHSWEGRDIFERTWLLLEAADRAEALATGAQTDANLSADVALAYRILADRLRLLASSIPDRNSGDDELGHPILL